MVRPPNLLIQSQVRNSNHATNQETLGIQDLVPSLQAMKNVVLIQLATSFVLFKKYILYLEFKMLMLTRCSGVMS